MGSVVFTDTHSSYNVSSYTYDVRVTYSEEFFKSSGKTRVRITAIDIRMRNNGTNWGQMPVYGSVKINGTTVMTLDGSASYTCHLSGGGYCPVTFPSSGYVDIQHDINGNASMNLMLVAGINDYFAMYYAFYNPGGTNTYLYAGVPTSTKNVSLTTRSSVLTVDPNGGLLDGSTDIKTFSQRPGTTKTLTTPVLVGYSFEEWAQSGGGSIDGSTYTFGDADGTLTASYSPMSTIHRRKAGQWKLYLIYIRKAGQWVMHQANVRKSGQWAKHY